MPNTARRTQVAFVGRIGGGVLIGVILAEARHRHGKRAATRPGSRGGAAHEELIRPAVTGGAHR
ncbi:hypothetical protein GCM10009754_19660 [Amycolatopsis minnesotensis]|uniref:Uncharacterized protein n=1 Tax=Amycolatopsis minnesotensis TaxID=337894 RepID=A0ABN2QF28_9PSEU